MVDYETIWEEAPDTPDFSAWPHEFQASWHYLRQRWVIPGDPCSNCHPTKSWALYNYFKLLEFGVVSVQFSHSVVSDSLRPHKLQHVRTPCPSPSPRVHLNSHPSSRWCHPTISSSVAPFSSCPQSFPASGSFQMSQLFTLRGQSIGFQLQHHSCNEHPGLISFRMDWLDLLAVQGTLKSLLQHHSSKASILWRSAFFIVQLSHPYMTTGKTIALTRQTLLAK